MNVTKETRLKKIRYYAWGVMGREFHRTTYAIWFNKQWRFVSEETFDALVTILKHVCKKKYPIFEDKVEFAARRKPVDYRLSELSYDQREELVWRLTRKMDVPLDEAMKISRGDKGDLTLLECFQKANASDHKSKINAKLVMSV